MDDNSSTDTRVLVQSTDPASGSVTLHFMSDKTTHVYNMDGIISINIDGNSGHFSDIHAGMQVTDYQERDSQSLDSISLTNKVSPPPADSGTGKKKKKVAASS